MSEGRSPTDLVVPESAPRQKPGHEQSPVECGEEDTLLTAPTAAKKPPFMVVATEIRQTIYREVFGNAFRVSKDSSLAHFEVRDQTPQTTSLLEVCRQVYLEALPILYHTIYCVRQQDIRNSAFLFLNPHINLIKTVALDNFSWKVQSESKRLYSRPDNPVWLKTFSGLQRCLVIFRDYDSYLDDKPSKLSFQWLFQQLKKARDVLSRTGPVFTFELCLMFCVKDEQNEEAPQGGGKLSQLNGNEHGNEDCSAKGSRDDTEDAAEDVVGKVSYSGSASYTVTKMQQEFVVDYKKDLMVKTDNHLRAMAVLLITAQTTTEGKKNALNAQPKWVKDFRTAKNMERRRAMNVNAMTLLRKNLQATSFAHGKYPMRA
jgi:hypothetical protein